MIMLFILNIIHIILTNNKHIIIFYNYNCNTYFDIKHTIHETSNLELPLNYKFNPKK